MRAVGAVIASAVIVLFLITALVAGTRPVPQCEEDQVLIGTGDFDAGRWDAYVCGPAVDDYDPSL